ncbi:cytochrome P450 [Solwaraspora sp. WMMA2080]|uniref:cytochrome P450 n=1 Tax=unclassified Solwaraspora TaxID=2627926 RepID=UPI00248C6A79|nr:MULTISPECIES: cytochrome P450 [unclassified Solwaraspora]WBB99618.1 cytochrome P450 [Solwaraspora sp. WMMA2059]WBC21831.1 cytochrome P450 [Solwaraspora sp. WMMA2080]
MPELRAAEPRSYPFTAPDRLNLDDTYRQLQQDRTLVRVQLPFGEPAWLATRHADVRFVLGDARFSRAASVGRDEPRITPRQIEGGILSMDPPEHTRLRRLVAKAFTGRRVEQLRPQTRQFADELLTGMIGDGPPADLVERFATPLPVRVICELLGVPYADREHFHTWSEAVVSTTSLSPEQVTGYLENLHGYIAGLVEQRRRHPTDDLLGAMVHARDTDASRLTETELVQLAAGLLAAGHETTVTQIPNFVYVLLTQPDQFAALRADPALVPGAVEELTRYVPLGAASSFARYATVDVEVGGVLVRAGEPVIGSLSAANRDPEVFTDPDRLDLTRTVNPHVGFGHGVHHCLGAQLARMELQVAVEAVVRRLPQLRLAVPEDQLVWKTGLLVRGLNAMPVTWG